MENKTNLRTQMMYPTDKSSRYLFRAGGFTAILFLVYSFVTILILVFLDGGYPETATECFDMLKENKFIGLLRLDIVSVIVIPFYYLLFFSLYYALKKDHELIAQIALFCTLAGVTIFISGVNIASIVIVSDKYHLATSPELKQQLLAAGEAMLASDMWINTGAIIRGILIETGAVIFSILMLRTNVFNKMTGWVGVLTHGFDLSSIIIGLFIPAIKDIFTMVAGPLYIVWFVLIAIRLFQLGTNRDEPKLSPIKQQFAG
jgi:hypothetical protein